MKSNLAKSSERLIKAKARQLCQPAPKAPEPYAKRLVSALNREAARDGFFVRLAGQDVKCTGARIRRGALQVRTVAGDWTTPGALTFADPYGLEIVIK